MGAGLNGIVFDVTPNPCFKVNILTSRISKKTVRFGDKVTKEHQ